MSQAFSTGHSPFGTDLRSAMIADADDVARLLTDLGYPCEIDDAVERIFGFLGTDLVMRSPTTPRRRESLWRSQYELLHDLQCSPVNRHPNPKFGLDQITTACVALCQQADPSGAAVLGQARHNMVERHLVQRAPQQRR